jgi:hypothetical protein
MAVQDYKDSLEIFDYLYKLIDDNKGTLGIKYVAQLDEELLPQYPAVLITLEGPTQREQHATRMFRVEWHCDLWVFHAELTVGKAIRSRQDVELATRVRKLVHTKFTFDDHIIFGFIDGEFPGRALRRIGAKQTTIVATRLTWMGENRVLYQDS